MKTDENNELHIPAAKARRPYTVSLAECLTAVPAAAQGLNSSAPRIDPVRGREGKRLHGVAARLRKGRGCVAEMAN